MPPAPPPEHCLLQGLQVALASVQGPAGEVDAHGVDADIVWEEGERGRPGSGRQRPGSSPRGWRRLPSALLTDVVGLVEDHHGLAGQLLGHQVCNLGVQEVVVAVNHHIGVQDLGEGEKGEGYTEPAATPNP